MTDPFEKVLPGRADERALNAMAEVVRRARQMTQATEAEPPGGAAGGPPLDPSRRTAEVRSLDASHRTARDRRGDPRGAARPHPRNGAVPKGATTRPGARTGATAGDTPRLGEPAGDTPRLGEPAGDASRFGEKVLRASVVVVGALVLGLGSAVVTLRLSGHADAPAVPTATGRVQGHAPSANGVRGRPAPSRGPSAAAPVAVPSGSPVTSAEQPAAPGRTPQLVSLSPTGGSAGQVVTVSGVNLFSADGIVQASVGGAPAPTSCATETACTVTVPAQTGPPSSLPLTIETEAGTSNPLPFSYGR